jgi:hypothetical protein
LFAIDKDCYEYLCMYQNVPTRRLSLCFHVARIIMFVVSLDNDGTANRFHFQGSRLFYS